LSRFTDDESERYSYRHEVNLSAARRLAERDRLHQARHALKGPTDGVRVATRGRDPASRLRATGEPNPPCPPDAPN